MKISLTTVVFSSLSFRAGEDGKTIAEIKTIMEKDVPIGEEVDTEALTSLVNEQVKEATITTIEESDGELINISALPDVVSEVEVTELKTAPGRDEPTFRLFQLQRKLGDVIENHFAKWTGWSKRIRRVIDDRIHKMEIDFNKKSETCDFGLAERISDDNRYDKDDACKASKQLTRNLITWSSKFNVHCETGKENKFHTKIVQQLENLEKRLKKRINCVVN